MNSFFLAHVLQTLIFPPALNIMLAGIGFLIYFFKRKIGLSIITFSVILLWLFSTPFFAYNLIDNLQHRYPALNDLISQPGNSRTAIVILGGGDVMALEQNNKYIISDVTLSRLRYAAYLSKKLQIPIIVSGGKVNGALISSAHTMLESLQTDFNVPTAIVEDKSTDTIDESKFMVPLLKANNLDKIYLVTTAWHMPRSIYFFKREGIDVIPAPMGFEVYDHNYTLLSFLPNARALGMTTIAFHEFIGLFIAYANLES